MGVLVLLWEFNPRACAGRRPIPLLSFGSKPAVVVPDPLYSIAACELTFVRNAFFDPHMITALSNAGAEKIDADPMTRSMVQNASRVGTQCCCALITAYPTPLFRKAA
jgi:hypothetical protein